MKSIKDYPPKLTSNRNKIEGAFVFSLWKQPELYDDFELNTDSELLTEDGKFYYSLGQKMYDKGITVFDEVSILSFLDNSDELLEQFNKKGGCRVVNEMKSIVASENVDSYHDEILKNNAVLQLFDQGYFFRDEEELAKVQTEMNYAQLEDYLEFKINNIFLKSTSNGINVGDLTSKYEMYINQWNEGTGMGMPLGFKKLNYHLAGLHTSNLILHLGGIGSGKLQHLDAKIATPDGWKSMGDMKIGSKVFGEDGKVHNVTGVFPQGVQESYRVTFSDGTSTESGLDHLWDVQTNKQRELTEKTGKYYHRVITLREIMKEYYQKGNGYIYSIPTTKPVEYSKKDLNIDSEFLGLLLGDGGITSKTISFTNSELDILNKFKKHLEKMNITYCENDRVTHKRLNLHKSKSSKLISELSNLHLMGCGSREKFIPQEYLFSNIEDRAKLLSALLNTDGCVEKGVSFRFSSYSKQLAIDVRELALSLGINATYYEKDRTSNESTSKYEKEIEYTIHLMGEFEVIIPYLSDKHKSKLKNRKRKYKKSIINIEYVGDKESQCIMVDNPSHLYLTDDYIVTHNTTSALLTYILPILEAGEHVCIIANEQNEEQFAQMMLATILFNRIKDRKGTKMNRQKLLFGNFSDDELDDLKRASEYLKKFKGFLHYIHLTDYGTTNVKRIIKRYSKLGVKAFLFDTLKPYDESSDRAWAEFSETAKALFSLAQKEEIAIVATAQLSSESAKRKFLDLSCIGKSRAIAETASTVIMFRRLQKSEIEKLFVYDYLKGTNTPKKIDLDLNKDYVVYFIPKNRYGTTEKQIVYERNMSFNTMREIGYCDIEYDGFSK